MVMDGLGLSLTDAATGLKFEDLLLLLLMVLEAVVLTLLLLMLCRWP